MCVCGVFCVVFLIASSLCCGPFHGVGVNVFVDCLLRGLVVASGCVVVLVDTYGVFCFVFLIESSLCCGPFLRVEMNASVTRFFLFVSILDCRFPSAAVVAAVANSAVIAVFMVVSVVVVLVTVIVSVVAVVAVVLTVIAFVVISVIVLSTTLSWSWSSR